MQKPPRFPIHSCSGDYNFLSQNPDTLTEVFVAAILVLYVLLPSAKGKLKDTAGPIYILRQKKLDRIFEIRTVLNIWNF